MKKIGQCIGTEGSVQNFRNCETKLSQGKSVIKARKEKRHSSDKQKFSKRGLPWIF